MEISCSSLLCHEELFTSPSPVPPSSFPLRLNLEEHAAVQVEECYHAFQIYLQREHEYAACFDGYVDRLRSSPHLSKARFRGVQWMLLVMPIDAIYVRLLEFCPKFELQFSNQASLHLNLSPKAIFAAVNYFDRFLSASRRSQNWQTWMAELISIACLSIASKFEEVCHPTFDEFQMKDSETDKKFDPGTIKKMELLVLQVLDWKLNCVTSYSYTELLSGRFSTALMARITDLLIHTLYESKFVEHNPSVVAVSVLRYVAKEIAPMRIDLSFSFFDQLISVECKAKIHVCSKIIEDYYAEA